MGDDTLSRVRSVERWAERELRAARERARLREGSTRQEVERILKAAQAEAARVKEETVRRGRAEIAKEVEEIEATFQKRAGRVAAMAEIHREKALKRAVEMVLEG